VTCQASFALPPGTALTLADHPRADVNIPLLVLRARTTVVFGAAAKHELECMDLESAFRPARLPKPRIHGTQTAMVVGAPGEEIDVDSFGRVQVEFRWDRRDLHTGSLSRRVRVAQGWAGAGYGFVMLPRINDEVVIAYEDGDPDHPLIVGRVHNAIVTTPLNLPDQKTRSTWRSRSSPGGAGFNEIVMEDAAGNERLSFHGHRDSQFFTGRNSDTVIGQSQSVSVGAGQSMTIGGDQRTVVTGNLETSAATMDLRGKSSFYAHTEGTMYLNAAGDQEVSAKGSYHVRSMCTYLESGDVVQVNAGYVHVFARTEIHLQAGASSIHITDGEVTIVSPMIKLNP
jgi:type VI secretion system secreted protein VgrG